MVKKDAHNIPKISRNTVKAQHFFLKGENLMSSIHVSFSLCTFTAHLLYWQLLLHWLLTPDEDWSVIKAVQ